MKATLLIQAAKCVFKAKRVTNQPLAKMLPKFVCPYENNNCMLSSLKYTTNAPDISG